MSENVAPRSIDEWVPRVVGEAKILLENTSKNNPLYHEIQDLVYAIESLPAWLEQDRKEMSKWLKGEAKRAETDYEERVAESLHAPAVSDAHGTLSLLLGKSSFAWYLWGAYGSKYKVL